MSKLPYLFEELKARNVRKTLAIYLASALTTLTIVRYFAEAYELPRFVLAIAVTILSCGMISAFVFAWYHGKEGSQKTTRTEMVLHTLVALVALVTSIRFAAGPSEPNPAALFRPGAGETIAVLPFKNLSDSKEDEYFSDGITEDILTQLAKIGELNVISRTSVMKYKNTAKSIREIARELGATAILEGSVRRSGTRVRITGQLIYAPDDKHLWAETYDRELRDIFAIQTEVAHNIARELRARLSPEEQKLLQAEPTRNLEAYGLYLRARDLQNGRTLEGNKRAAELLHQAIALDSNYAGAYALLGLTHIARYLAFGYSSASVDTGITFAQKAVRLDPDLPDGYHAVGKGYEALGKLSLALPQYNRAIQLSPNYAPAFASIGFIHFGFGRIDEALWWMRKGVTLTPDVAARYVNVGSMYDFLGEDSLALQWHRRALALDDKLIVAHWSLVYHYLNQGNIHQARWHAAQAFAVSPGDVSILHAAGDIEMMDKNFALAQDYYRKSVAGSSSYDGPGNQLAFTLLKIGKRREAEAILDSNLAYFIKQSSAYPEDAYNPVAVATIYAIRSRPKEAIPWLQRAVDRGWRDYHWALIEPMFEALRPDPDFQALMNTLGAHIAAMRLSAQQRGLLD